jgi:hypothetical protein
MERAQPRQDLEALMAGLAQFSGPAKTLAHLGCSVTLEGRQDLAPDDL